MHAFKSFNQIPEQLPEPAVPVEPSPQLQQRFKRMWRPPVVDSEHIKWKPIDKVAARVVAPAKDYDLPPVPPPKFNRQKNMPEKTDSLKPASESRLKTKTVLTKEGFRETLIDVNSVTAAAVDHHDESVKKEIKKIEELTEKSRELIATIDHLATEIGGPFTELQDFIKLALTTIRDQRIAMGSETRLLLGALKDVREFFLNQTYEVEISRLHEFVDLCERLKALQDSGFLDVIADTILKLSDN